MKIISFYKNLSQVAIKIFDKIRISKNSDIKIIEKEINILKILRHKNIIQLYSVIRTDKKIYVILEYASGNELLQYILSKKRLSESESCRIFQQLISGINYLHLLKISHRDLKPENILLDHKKDLKIADFGLSKEFKDGNLLYTICGSPSYTAPEMIAGLPYSGFKVDIWGCGIILFFMICGYLPFDDKNSKILYNKIIEGKYYFPYFVSDQARDLIKNILNTDPKKRYNIDQIISHPWFNSIKFTVSNGLLLHLNVIPVNYLF